MDKPITVTSPLLPDLQQFNSLLKEIWDNRWITNNGSFHQQLENELAEFLGVPYISLFANGTIPLITALQALDITGEVITTPYSFVATSHSIRWSGLSPVFVDIDPETCNINPQKIERAITPKTTAIMPVHCYGTPCDIDAIKDIADRYGLKVIYDAAHAFAVRKDGSSILNYGDISTLSFHATKVFNTIEGGAIVCQTPEMKAKIDKLKNFGFASETEIVGIGINGKLDEVRAAFGLLNLRKVNDAIASRKKIAQKYRNALSEIPGIRCLNEIPSVEHNYSHFPIFIEQKEFGISRDELYNKLKDNGILSRRYFFPLITSFDSYSKLPSAAPENLPAATHIAQTVLCLPLYPDLSESQTDKIINTIITSCKSI